MLIDGRSANPSNEVTFTPTADMPTPLAHELLPPGTEVGRYRIVERLAIGGMGVVFKAHDPQLSRHIALKLVQQSSIDIERHCAAEEYEQRLLREAQALARLSHPNVVAAFDVGRFGGALFIAMELIDGESLRTWLMAKQRSCQEILAILLEAGRGLSAAHRAGVVHRDFKLSNVMVSEQGRVQVVDFGLARTTGVVLEATPTVSAFETEVSSSAEGSSGASLHSSAELTRTGAVIGTPGYIAPEQFDGVPSDERSDQFSYASAAFRALTGRSAYPVDSLAAYRSALGGERAPWPKRVPRAVRKVIDRGLSRLPEQRYPNFDALLEDLQRAARPPRRLTLLVLAALGMSALVSTFTVRERFMRRCDPDLKSLERAWSSERSAQVKSAFERSGSPRAADSVAAVGTRVRNFRERWQDARQQACLATYERHEQSEQILGLRNACLDSKLHQFGTLAELFERADVALVDRAPEALDELTSVGDCSDILSLVGESDRLPDDPKLREPIRDLQRRWDALQAVYVTGRWADVLERGQALVRDAGEVGYKPIQARAMSQAVMALERLGRPEEAGELRQRTLEVASEAKVHDVLAQQALRMLRSNVDAVRIAEAKAMLPFVDVAVGLAGRPAALQIRLLTYQAAILSEEEDFQGAIERLERALAECRQLGTEGVRSCLTPQRELGLVYAARKDYAAARRELAATVDLAKLAFVPRHPNVVNEYNNSAEIMLRAEDVEAAARLVAESKIVAATLPADRQSTLIPMLEGRILVMRGDYPSALPLFEEGARRMAAAYGARTTQASYGLHELGKCLARLGETEAGIRHLEHALELRRTLRATPDWIASSAFALAEALWSVPAERHRANQLAEEALGIYQSGGQRWSEDVQRVSAWLGSHPAAHPRR
jgi:eukaryotic-like serine/threonine-protein kinase